MNITHFFSRTRLAGVLGVVVVLAVAVVLPLLAARGRDTVGSQSMPASPSALIPLESTYAGAAELDWVVPGVYSDTLTAPTGTLPDLGSIDLGFLLHCSNNSLNGYVDLSVTLVFTPEHVITSTQAITTPLAVGPAVQGTCDGAHLQFESERFTMVTEAGQRVTRQFRVTSMKSGLTSYVGEYRETLWGYGPQPYTIVGELDVALTSGENMALLNRIYLPVIRR